MVRELEFHRPQRSLQYNDHRLHKPWQMPNSYGMKTAVFAYHPLKTTLSNYLHSTHLDNIDSFIRTLYLLGLHRWISVTDDTCLKCIRVYRKITIPPTSVFSRHRLQQRSWTKEDESQLEGETLGIINLWPTWAMILYYCFRNNLKSTSKWDVRRAGTVSGPQDVSTATYMKNTLESACGKLHFESIQRSIAGASFLLLPCTCISHEKVRSLFSSLKLKLSFSNKKYLHDSFPSSMSAYAWALSTGTGWFVIKNDLDNRH